MTLLSFRSTLSFAATVILASSLYANQPPVFTNCVPPMTGSHCQTFWHDFDAVDPDGDSGLVYLLVSGIGHMSPYTGIWGIGYVAVGSHYVTIGVTDPQGSGDTTMCTFEVIATNVGPQITNCPTDTVEVSIPSKRFIYTNADDDCDPLIFDLVESGGVTGSVSMNPSSGLLEFTPAESDALLPQPISMEVSVTDGLETSYCEVRWRVLPRPAIKFSVAQVHTGYCVDTAVVPIGVKTDSSTSRVFGFDLLLAYDKSRIALKDVLPGNLITDCGWQYFHWQEETNTGCHTCPSGLFRITALAGNTGEPANACFSDTTLKSTIASAQFIQLRDDAQFFPIRFYWRDCNDNITLATTDTFASPTVLFSSHVFDWDWENDISTDASFPTYMGSPTSCLVEGEDTLWRLRHVDFRNGGIDTYCGGMWDATGDINLNGLSYETADFNMFRLYFTQGTSAFVGHTEGSKAASDVNHDNITGTLPDLISLYRIIQGLDTPPDSPNVSIIPTIIHYDASLGTTSFDTDDSLAAVRLLFKGTGSISVTGPANILSWGSYDTVTSVLLAPTDSSGLVAILNGTQLTISPPLPLISAEVTTIDAAFVQTFIDSPSGVNDPGDQALPAEFVLYQNYPNPFNPSTTITFAIPATSDVHLEIVNVLGQVVYEVIDRFAPGEHEFEWRGVSRDGNAVSSGVYYARLTAGTFKAVRKMMLLK